MLQAVYLGLESRRVVFQGDMSYPRIHGVVYVGCDLSSVDHVCHRPRLTAISSLLGRV